MLWCPCYALSQVWFGFNFSGKGYVPVEGPVLLVSNHQSNLDPVLVGIACAVAYEAGVFTTMSAPKPDGGIAGFVAARR